MSVSWEQIFPDPVPQRRRLVTWWRVIAIVVLAAAGTALGLAIWLATLSPLAYRGGVYGGGPATLDVAKVVPLAGKPEYVASAERAGYFTVAFDLNNSAPFSVRVLGLPPLDPHETPPEERRLVFRLGSDRWVPFEPFTLAPGEYRTIGVQTVVHEHGTCGPDESGSYAYGDVVPLRHRYLWLTREDWIEMPVVAATVCGDVPPSYDARGL